MNLAPIQSQPVLELPYLHLGSADCTSMYRSVVVLRFAKIGDGGGKLFDKGGSKLKP